MTSFRHSQAVVIGIDDYQHGIPPLRTAVNDAVRLAEILEQEHGYQVHLLVEAVTKARLQAFFTETLEVGPEDRLLVYFAGHGIALDGDDGPAGYLIPQDARPEEQDSFLPMAELHDWLDRLSCRHLLAIFDCCFAGAFRWASTRDAQRLPTVIYQERYERFVRDPAWQVITSAAYDQLALDVLSGEVLGQRGEGAQHSPFALALFEALAGAGDVVPAGKGDGIITATELYLYLRDSVEVRAEEQSRHRQTPGLWPLRKHDKGEYMFLVPGQELDLQPAPKLTAELNPWRGLKSYDEEHCQLFFGREDESDELAELVTGQPFTAVLGASGTGKSSLVKAGLLPRLRGCDPGKGQVDTGGEGSWCILPPLRPTATPLMALHQTLHRELPEFYDAEGLEWLRDKAYGLAYVLGAWRAQNSGRKLLLVIDQLEELVTLCRDDGEREQFLTLLARALEQEPEAFRLVITLRTDFEPQLAQDTPLAGPWAVEGARYVVPPLDHDDLQKVIEGPASVSVLYFEPRELVDDLIKEVIQTPGALPLLSFTLSELYLLYLARQEEGRRSGTTVDRSLTQGDYDRLGGVIGSLRNRATEEYEALPDDAHRRTMRQVMLRMVAVEGGELARRRVPRPELVYPQAEENERVETVIQRLVAARLVVEGRPEGGEPYVEPAHDALVRAWDKLLVWQGEAEDYLPLQRRLTDAASDWLQEDTETRPSLLWHSSPYLPQLEDILTHGQYEREHMSWFTRLILSIRDLFFIQTLQPSSNHWLDELELQFVQKSVEQRRRNTRRRVRITLGVFVALASLLVIALTLWRQSESNLAEVRRQLHISQAKRLASESFNWTETVPSRSLLLVAEAVTATMDLYEKDKWYPVYETEQAVYDALQQLNQVPILEHDEPVHSIAFDRKGNLAVSGGSPIAFSSVVGRLYAGDNLASIQVWSTRGGSPERVTSPEQADTVIVSDMPVHVLALGQDLSDLSGTYWYPKGVRPKGLEIETMAIASSDWVVVDFPGEDKNGNPLRISLPFTSTTDLAFNPSDDRQLIVGGRGSNPNKSAMVCDIDFAAAEDSSLTVTPLCTPFQAIFAGQPDAISLAFSPINVDSANAGDVRYLATTTSDGAVRLWSIPGGRIPHAPLPADSVVLYGHLGSINDAAFSRDGRFFATAGDDHTARLWRMSGLDSSPIVLNGHSDRVTSVAFSPDGRYLATASADKTVMLWPLDIRSSIDETTRVLCRNSGRNLSNLEWRQYVGGDEYRSTCPEWPAHPSVVTEFLRKGYDFAKDGDATNAAEQFEIAVSLDPTLEIEPELYAQTLVSRALSGQTTVWDGLTIDKYLQASQLIDAGRQLAQDGDLEGAIASLEQALEMDPSFAIDPSEQASHWYADGLLEEGDKLAQAGNIEQAIAAYNEALQFDPALNLEPERKAKQLRAQALMEELHKQVQASVIDEDTIAKFEEAVLLNPDLDDVDIWNGFCWDGSLWGYAAEVLSACEQAVIAAPDAGYVRDSRGLARALTGDFEGAIEDFKFFVEWLQQTDQYEAGAYSRENWIVELQAGRNPFDEATLAALLNE